MNRRLFLGSMTFLTMASKRILASAKQAARIDQEKCIHCGTCFKNCPVEAIEKTSKDDVDIYRVNPSLCISCGTCIANCPQEAIAFAEVNEGKKEKK